MFDSIRSVAASAVDSLQYVAEQDRERHSRYAIGCAPIPPAYCSCRTRPDKSPHCARRSRRGCGSAIFETMDRPETEADKPNGARRPLWFVVDELDALGANRRSQGRARTPAQIRRPLRARLSIRRAGLEHIRCGGCAHDCRKLRQHLDPAVLGERRRRHGPFRVAARRRSRGVAHDACRRAAAPRRFFGSRTRSQHISVEPALLPSQIEQLPDLTGYLKHASKAVLAAREPFAVCIAEATGCGGSDDEGGASCRLGADRRTGIRHADRGFDHG